MAAKKKTESGAAINDPIEKSGAGNAAVRDNPKPFHLHLLTTANMLSAAAASFLGPAAVDSQQKQKVIDVVQAMTAQMMEGLAAYKASKAKPERRTHTVIWQEGSTRLLRTNPNAPNQTEAILLVPSLINRYDILDLDAQHSFVAFLQDEGFDPYILDWGPPGEAEANFTIDTYIIERLYPALSRIKNPHVIGYCMGGTMAAGAVAALPDQSNIKSLTLLAAPWDFHAGDPAMALRMNVFMSSAELVMQAQNRLPVDWIQALFASIDPLFAFNKFRAFAQMDQTSPQARQFVIVEDWLNDGVDMTANAARQSLANWYIQNEPHNGVWTIGKNLADAGAIKVPTLVVAATGDKLVPAPSALAILQHIAAAESLTPDLGHIGLMASPRAKAAVWAPIADWLKRRTAQ